MDIRCFLVLCLFIGSLQSIVVRADIINWRNGQVIPETEGITPGPGAKLRRRDLEYADLRDFDLTEATFYRSNLTGANFERSNLADADLSKVTLIRPI